jgi:hypothetical protein
LGLEGTVYFAGYHEDLRPFYRDSALTLICSIKEGVAITAYESLSMGVPVISADVGGQAELLDGSTGAVLPLLQDEERDLDARSFLADEISQYVSAIVCVLNNPAGYDKMKKACRERVEKFFSTDVMIRTLEAELSGIVSDPALGERREAAARALGLFPGLARETAVLYGELALRGGLASGAASIRNELARIADSGFGRTLIRVMLRLGLNKLFK